MIWTRSPEYAPWREVTRRLRSVGVAAWLVSMATTCGLAGAAYADDFPPRLSGVVASVESGDLLIVVSGGRRYRIVLDAVAAPEKDQPRADESKEALRRLALGRKVDVRCVGGDRLRGIRGRVTLNGRSLNKQVVESGWAWYDDREVKSAAMVAAMEAARQARRGLWQDENPMAPWEWAARLAAERTARREHPRQVREQVEAFLRAVKRGDVARMKRYLSQRAAEIVADDMIKPPQFIRRQNFVVGKVDVDGSVAHVTVETTDDDQATGPNRGRRRPRGSRRANRRRPVPPQPGVPPGGRPKAQQETGDLVLRLESEGWAITAIRLPRDDRDEKWVFDLEDPNVDIGALGQQLRNKLEGASVAPPVPRVASKPLLPSASQPAGANKAANAKPPKPAVASKPAVQAGAPAAGAPPAAGKSPAAMQAQPTKGEEQPAADAPASQPAPMPAATTPSSPASPADKPAASPMPASEAKAKPTQQKPAAQPKSPLPKVDAEKLASVEKAFSDVRSAFDKSFATYRETVSQLTGPRAALVDVIPDPRETFAQQSLKFAKEVRGTPLAARMLLSVCETAASKKTGDQVQKAAELLLADHRSDAVMIDAAARLSDSAVYDPRPFYEALLADDVPAEIRAAAGCFLAQYQMKRGGIPKEKERFVGLLREAVQNHADVDTPAGKLGQVASAVLEKLEPEASADSDSEAAEASE